MCGIAGFLDTSGQRSELSLLEIAQRMSNAWRIVGQTMKGIGLIPLPA